MRICFYIAYFILIWCLKQPYTYRYLFTITTVLHMFCRDILYRKETSIFSWPSKQLRVCYGLQDVIQFSFINITECIYTSGYIPSEITRARTNVQVAQLWQRDRASSVILRRWVTLRLNFRL